jgi:hypothetical protein
MKNIHFSCVPVEGPYSRRTITKLIMTSAVVLNEYRHVPLGAA